MLRGKAAAAAGVDNVCDEESRWASLVATIERERQKCEPSSGHSIFTQRANGTFPACARDFVRYPKLATMVLFFAFALNKGKGKGPIFTAVRPAVNVSDGGQADGDGRRASLARRGVTFALVRAVERSTGNPHSCIRRRYGRSRGRGRTEGRDGRDVGGSEERAPSVAANDIIELRARFPPRSLSPFKIPRRVCLIVVRRDADVSGGCRMHYRHRLRRSVDRPPSRPGTDWTE